MKCEVVDCESEQYASGLCSKHYNRRIATGSTGDGPRARAPLDVRFWRQVARGAVDECWPWVGKSLVRGYGFISTGGRGSKKEPSNRIAWLLANGPIPEGHVVRHRCHNRLCCNPAHLMLGSRADNVADMWERPDTAPRGNARLTTEQVEAIRSDPRSSRVLAPIYGVHHAHIRSIRRKRTWKG